MTVNGVGKGQGRDRFADDKNRHRNSINVPCGERKKEAVQNKMSMRVKADGDTGEWEWEWECLKGMTIAR